MSGKKTADLSAGLVATKGQAATATATAASAPLNFKVSPDFHRRFRQRAAVADLKLNQLLQQALDAWEEKHGLK